MLAVISEWNENDSNLLDLKLKVICKDFKSVYKGRSEQNLLMQLQMEFLQPLSEMVLHSQL